MIYIITDSTSEIPQIETNNKNLVVVPLHNLFGNEDNLDGVTISTEEFYQRLATTETLPTTSQPSPEEFLTHFNKVKEEGSSAVVLTVSSKVSGTYQSACIAKDLCEYENIHIVDSLTVTIGLNCLVKFALALREKGMSAKKIVAELEAIKDRVKVIALVDTLKYLKKGGRLSATVALAGTFLNIKPIIEVSDGVLAVAAKARGINSAYKKVIDLIEEKGGVDDSYPFCIGYSGEPSLTENFATCIKRHLKQTNISSIAIGSTIGVHAGPGACGVAFFSR